MVFGPPGAPETVKHVVFGPPGAPDTVKYVVFGSPGATHTVKYVVFGPPGAPDAVKYVVFAPPGYEVCSKFDTPFWTTFFDHTKSINKEPNAILKHPCRREALTPCVSYT